jgi:1-acyl-sn-glycerol-3-phosphate acyltransferase
MAQGQGRAGRGATPARGNSRAAIAAVSAGALRASGERAVRQRRTTPLLADRPVAGAGEEIPVPPSAVTSPADARVPADTGRPAGTRRPERTPKPADARRPDGTAKRATPKPATSAVERETTGRNATPLAGGPAGPSGTDVSGTPTAIRPRTSGNPPPRVRVRAASSSGGGGGSAGAPRAGRERLVAVASMASEAGEDLADALRPGTAPSDLEERIVGLLQLLRRRLTGEYEVDEFGFDPELTDKVLFALLRPLYRRWFRVEVSGIDNIPATGGALVVANHSGAVALDSLITAVAVHDEHPARRFLRSLGADLVFSTPFVGELARKGGATLAANADAERLLSAGELVGVWPEGFKGVGKPFSERYKLQRFGRGGFVSAALRTRTPIVPCSIVGAEESYPIIGNMPTLARLLGLPYVPVTPTWPLLGPLGMIPLPSKWLIEFGPPVATGELGTGAADDPMLVFDLTDQIRQTIQQTLYSLLIQRRSVFF